MLVTHRHTLSTRKLKEEVADLAIFIGISRYEFWRTSLETSNLFLTKTLMASRHLLPKKTKDFCKFIF
jgi:hypothetical protein